MFAVHRLCDPQHVSRAPASAVAPAKAGAGVGHCAIRVVPGRGAIRSHRAVSRAPQHALASPRGHCVRRRCHGRVRLRAGEHSLYASEHELVNLPAVPESHFQLLRMRVDVDELRIEREVQDVGRVPATVENVPICDSHGVHQ